MKLARNPGSLAALCARLAENDGEVVSAGWRSELMWFEMVEAADLAGDKDPEAKVRTRRELVERASAASAQAGKDVPPNIASASSNGSPITPPITLPTSSPREHPALVDDSVLPTTFCSGPRGDRASASERGHGGRRRLSATTLTR